MTVMNNMKRWIMKFLGIVPSKSFATIQVYENATREVNTLKNQIWYRGDGVEIEQFWKQFAQGFAQGVTYIPNSMFWSSVPSNSLTIRKMHTGLPRLIVDKLTDIVVADMHEPEMDEANKMLWDNITEENDFKAVIKKALQKTLSEGDGAYKISTDTDMSDYPIIEFYSGNDVDFVYKRGRLQEILFYTDYIIDDKDYKLIEIYGKGYVNYRLITKDGKQQNIDRFQEFEGLNDVTFDGDFIMGVTSILKPSAKFEGRGDAIYEGKADSFDALDETVSTWIDGLRAGRVKQYLPEDMIPRDEENGTMMKPDVFNPYIPVRAGMLEDQQEKIEVIQGEVVYEGFVSSYVTFLDMCLQGIISPSTLGIDVKKLDNAESQREKEKTTLYTRDDMVEMLQVDIPELIDKVLKVNEIMAKNTPEEHKATIEFGQYANPSFEAQVETVGKARTLGIMSIEKCIEELYGDDLPKKDKEEEVARLKAEEQSKMEVIEVPSLEDDLNAK